MNTTTAQHEKLAKAALFLLGIGIACAQWPIAISTGVILTSTAWLLYYGSRFYPKLSELKKDTVRVIKLPKGSYVVPVKVIEKPKLGWLSKLIHPMRRWRVEYVYPELEGTVLLLTRHTCQISKVKLIDPTKKNPPSCERAMLMSRAVKVIRDTQPKITALEQDLAASRADEQLGLSSSLFIPRSKTIVLSKVRQLEKNIDVLGGIQQKCQEFIRNVLIGERLSKYEDLSKSPDLAAQSLLQQAKYADVGEQAQLMTEEEAALMALIEETPTCP